MEVSDESYELFRRAVVQRDADAWAAIAARYRTLLIAWAWRCQARHTAQESSEDLADRALTRAWAALTPERFTSFPNTAALLGYLRACVTATVIDAARAQAVQERAMCLRAADAIATPEQVTLARLQREELWEIISRLVASETERVVLIERFVLDLPPRAIQARHPLLFADVSVVYACVRNLCERLRRNRNLQELYAEGHMA